MRTIGFIPARGLPSAALGLRISEMRRLGFDRIIVHDPDDARYARQFQTIEIVASEDAANAVSDESDAMVVVNSRDKLDAESMTALGSPGELEARCLAGTAGTPSFARYDRRRGIHRYSRGDSGDVDVEVPDMRGPIAVRAVTFAKLCRGAGAGWTYSGREYAGAARAHGVRTTCSDPVAAGVRWHVGTVLGHVPRGIEDRNEKTTAPKPVSQKCCDATVQKQECRQAGQAGIEKAVTELAKYDEDTPPILPVCFITHNRTAVACHCLDALCKRLRYAGRIHFCICDDMSVDGHVEALERVLKSNGILEHSVTRTSGSRHGLGASMNNGLRMSFSMSDVVLTSEDDFLIVRDFDITSYVRLIVANSIAGIRLAHLETHRKGWKIFTTDDAKSDFNGFVKVIGGNRKLAADRFVFNNQVMLRHRRVYDALGMYSEKVGRGIDIGVSEIGMTAAYNRRFMDGRGKECQVLYPAELKTDTFDNGLFLHIGLSTASHPYKVPDEFVQMNTTDADERARNGIMRAPDSVVLNLLDYPGRLGNLLMLIVRTYLDAAKTGVSAKNVFFRKNVDTRDGWVDHTGRKGGVLHNYLEQNSDILSPIWDNFLSDDDISSLRRDRAVSCAANKDISPRIIHEFEQEITNGPDGFISALLYDERVFASHRRPFAHYYSMDSVALHVRLTDFKFLKTKMGARFDPEGRASTLIDGCEGKTVVVFSDDIGWCRSRLKAPKGGKILFHDAQGAPCDDLILMSCFRTVLQTDEISTYSLVARLLSRDLQRTGKMTWCGETDGSGSNMPGLHFMTFATSDWTNARKRMLDDAKRLRTACPELRSASVMSESDLDEKWRNRYGRYSGDHAYALWSWKPYLMRERMDLMEHGDVLMYMDGGCTLPSGDLSSFSRDIGERCRSLSDTDFLGCCVYDGPIRIWQQCPVELLRHLGIGERNMDFGERFPHYEAGLLLIRKSECSVRFLDRWNRVFDECYESCFHGPFSGRKGEPRGFVHNGSDQAIFQCLLYLGGLRPVVCNDLFYEKYHVYSRTRG